MIDEMKTDLDYAAVAATLKETLGLSQSPVALKFAKNEEGIPAGIPEVADVMRHCQMISKAGREGAVFYARADKHACMGGAWALGLKELTESLKSGEFYFKLGKFDTWAGCMRTIKNIPRVVPPNNEGGPSTYATVYAPLEKTPFDPHVVLILAQPFQMLKLAQAVLYKTGGRVESSFAGIQSVCADTAAYPYMTGKINFSLGCDGSRKFSGIDDELMVMGIPGEMLGDIANAVPIVTGAAGSK